MAKVRELVGEMATIQMEYGESFWAALRPVQHAKGLTATPHTIYDVNALGIEIGESRAVGAGRRALMSTQGSA